MSKNVFIRVGDMVNELQISKAHAYKLMQKMNDELKEKGYLTISGRVSRQFYEEKFYGINQNKKEA